jgi:hypothetical protein
MDIIDFAATDSHNHDQIPSRPVFGQMRHSVSIIKKWG